MKLSRSFRSTILHVPLLLGVLWSEQSNAGVGLGINTGATYRTGYDAGFYVFKPQFGVPYFGMSGLAEGRRFALRAQLDYSTYRLVADSIGAAPQSYTIISAVTFAQFKAGKWALGPGAGMGYLLDDYSTGQYAFIGGSLTYTVNKLITLEFRGVSDLASPYKFKDWLFNLGLTFVAFDGSD